MLVYVESNFALEIALAQEEGDVAEGILKLAESREITLAIPSFALSEPYSNVSLRRVLRGQVLNDLRGQETQLRRSALHRDLATNISAVASGLSVIERQETDRLEETIRARAELYQGEHLQRHIERYLEKNAAVNLLQCGHNYHTHTSGTSTPKARRTREGRPEAESLPVTRPVETHPHNDFERMSHMSACDKGSRPPPLPGMQRGRL